MLRVVLLLLTMAVVNPAIGQTRHSKWARRVKRMNTVGGDVNSFRQKRYTSVTCGLNLLNYFGDLSPGSSSMSTDLGLTKPGIGIGYERKFTPCISVRVNFTYGAVQGSDHKSADSNDPRNGIYRFQRNLSFRNRIEELSVTAAVELFKNRSFYVHRPWWAPFAFAGVALFHHNPQAQVPSTDLDGEAFANAGSWVNLRPLGTEGQFLELDPSSSNHGIKPYHRLQVSVPLGIGVRARLNTYWDFSVEFSMRYLFTDYIDDVSASYVDLGAFGGNRLARALSYRSNERFAPNRTYTSRYDGSVNSVVSGYGEDGPGNIRGNRKDKDMITVLTFKTSLIISKNIFRAKCRYQNGVYH